MWDIREVKVMNVYDCGPHPANGLSVDRSSTYAALASDDCTIKLYVNALLPTAPLILGLRLFGL